MKYGREQALIKVRELAKLALGCEGNYMDLLDELQNILDVVESTDVAFPSTDDEAGVL